MISREPTHEQRLKCYDTENPAQRYSIESILLEYVYVHTTMLKKERSRSSSSSPLSECSAITSSDREVKAWKCEAWSKSSVAFQGMLRVNFSSIVVRYKTVRTRTRSNCQFFVFNNKKCAIRRAFGQKMAALTVPISRQVYIVRNP
jgi:hypothetical protein